MEILSLRDNRRTGEGTLAWQQALQVKSMALTDDHMGIRSLFEVGL